MAEKKIIVGDDFPENVTYSVVPLDEDMRKDGNPAVAGLEIDGVTIRIDDVSFDKENDEDDFVTMNVDYQVVGQKQPEDLDAFHQKVSTVLADVVRHYAETAAQ